MRSRLAQALVAGTTLALSAACHAGFDELNMTRGVTPISEEVYDLHMLALWITVAIGIVVFGAMFYSMAFHRKSLGVTPAQFHHSTRAEVLWTVIPCLILIGMAWPATKSLMAIEDPSESDMSIKVTAYQWAWQYDYMDEGISFYSVLAADSRAAITGDPESADHYLRNVDKPVVVPVNKKIRFLLTSNDVIHSWWVPDLGMKRDAIPGFINEMWATIHTPGIYRGQCAELCGRDHGFMPIVVDARSEEDYAAWVAEQTRASGDRARTAAIAARSEADTL